jgi:hypothetical protein
MPPRRRNNNNAAVAVAPPAYGVAAPGGPAAIAGVPVAAAPLHAVRNIKQPIFEEGGDWTVSQFFDRYDLWCAAQGIVSPLQKVGLLRFSLPADLDSMVASLKPKPAVAVDPHAVPPVLVAVPAETEEQYYDRVVDTLTELYLPTGQQVIANKLELRKFKKKPGQPFPDFLAEWEALRSEVVPETRDTEADKITDLLCCLETWASNKYADVAGLYQADSYRACVAYLAGLYQRRAREVQEESDARKQSHHSEGIMSVVSSLPHYEREKVKIARANRGGILPYRVGLASSGHVSRIDAAQVMSLDRHADITNARLTDSESRITKLMEVIARGIVAIGEGNRKRKKPRPVSDDDSATDDDDDDRHVGRGAKRSKNGRGEQRRRNHVAPASPQAAAAAPRDERPVCPHCGRVGHSVERCWDKNPSLRPARPFNNNNNRQADIVVNRPNAPPQARVPIAHAVNPMGAIHEFMVEQPRQ